MQVHPINRYIFKEPPTPLSPISGTKEPIHSGRAKKPDSTMTAIPNQMNSAQTRGTALVCVLPEPVADTSREAVDSPSPATCFQAGPCSALRTLPRRVVLLNIGTRVKIHSLRHTDEPQSAHWNRSCHVTGCVQSSPRPTALHS